jgi:ketosteroid isomerase-like protein
MDAAQHREQVELTRAGLLAKGTMTDGLALGHGWVANRERRRPGDTGRAMSQANVEVATQAIEAFNETDVRAFVVLTTPDFEWSPSMVAIEGTIFRGREGIERYFQSLGGAWEKFHIHRGRFRAAEDLVVMLGRLEGRGVGSGVPVDASLGMVFDFRGGLISRIRGYLDHAEALEAAGLAE